MLLAILLTHFVFGGFLPHVATNLYDAVSEFFYTKNWLNTGYFSPHDYRHLMRKAISWTCIALAYAIAYGTIIFISVTLLSKC